MNSMHINLLLLGGLCANLHLADSGRRIRSRDDEDIYLRKPLEPDVIRPTLAQLLARRDAA
jgi:hypothetical protein